MLFDDVLEDLFPLFHSTVSRES